MDPILKKKNKMLIAKDCHLKNYYLKKKMSSLVEVLMENLQFLKTMENNGKNL